MARHAMENHAIHCFYWGPAVAPCCSWGDSSPPHPLAGGLDPPLKLSVFFSTQILVPRSWYQDLQAKILVPRSWYQDPGTRILVPGTARHGNIWHGTDHKGTARKYLARHGSTRSGHGTTRDIPATVTTFATQVNTSERRPQGPSSYR